MQGAPERKRGEDGLPVPLYAVYNIGNGHSENLLTFMKIPEEEPVRAGVLPPDYDFEAHKEPVPMQAGNVPVTFADTTLLERDFGFSRKPIFAPASGALPNGTGRMTGKKQNKVNLHGNLKGNP